METGDAIFIIGLIVAAILLTAITFAFKQSMQVMGMVAGFMWVIVGMAEIGANIWLGIFSFLIAVIVMLAPTYAGEKEKPTEIVNKTYIQALDEHTDQYRQARKRTRKPAGGWYDK